VFREFGSKFSEVFGRQFLNRQISSKVGDNPFTVFEIAYESEFDDIPAFDQQLLRC
jgi:hypothetical protein